MSLGTWFRRVLRGSFVAPKSPFEFEERQGNVPASRGDASSGSCSADEKRLSAESRAQAEAWLAASDAGCLDPPQDIHDRGAWDEYWRNQLNVGALDQGFADQMSSDTKLTGLLAGRGSTEILCAGIGLSIEAISLALHGFNVTALDVSAMPEELFGGMLRDTEHPIRQIPGFGMGDDGSVTFGGAGPIDPALCPPMHLGADYPPRGGGSARFVTGDLTDPEVCPGPFDVVIERRTLQLFPEEEQLVALDRLVARLSSRGAFVSQQHEGRWRPGDDRTHYAEVWLASRGFVMHSEPTLQESGVAARLACLMFSSG
jgi:hypothetical protein